MRSQKFPDIAAFRLRRHHLRDTKPADLVTICRDVCGIQAQVMSAAYLQLWARNHSIRRPELESALWKSKTLVKTSLMRQTLHLIPTDEFAIYIAAVRNSRIAAVLRIMARMGIIAEEAHELSALIMKALADGPAGHAEIRAFVQPRVSKRLHDWMSRVWSIVRIPVSDGSVCYGSGDGNQVMFIRTDHWLGKIKPMAEHEAQCALFRKYLRAYGPATPADFAHWAGVPMKDARNLCESLKTELREIEVDGEKCLLLAEDLRNLTKPASNPVKINLLPLFDPYLLAHADKDHLIEPKHYKRVYRNQGWISPVILLDGKIVGTWSYKFRGGRMALQLDPFEKLSRPVREQVNAEAASLGKFFGKDVAIS